MLIFGIVTLVATVYIVSVVPDFLVRFVLWMATHTLFKIRIVGQENVPFRGPALLVANHMSHVDGFLISACVQRFIRFMVWKPYYELKVAATGFSGWRKRSRSAPAARGTWWSPSGAARKELEDGHVVCIFAEGAISRTGNLLPFKRGLEKIVARAGRSRDPGASGSVVGQHLQFRSAEGSSGSGPSACRIR